MEALVLLILAGVIIWFYGFIFRNYLFCGLEYECKFSVNEAVEGEDIFLIETVYNNKLLPLQWLKADMHTSRWLDFANTKSVIAGNSRFVTSGFSLGSYQKTVRKWRVKCLKRGVYAIKRISLVGGDLLGITSGSITADADIKLLVYPGIIRLEELFTCKKHYQGELIVKRWIIEDPFIISGTRQYSGYDSMNSIHWPATAKYGEIMVRKNDFTSQLSLRIFLNIQSMEFEYLETIDKNKIELGIKAAATIINKAVRMGIPFGLASNGSVVDGAAKPVFTALGSGQLHSAELLTILAKLELKKTMEFDDFLDETAMNIKDSEVIIITSYLSKNLCERIKKYKNKAYSLKVILLDKWNMEAGAEPCCYLYTLRQVE